MEQGQWKPLAADVAKEQWNQLIKDQKSSQLGILIDRLNGISAMLKEVRESKVSDATKETVYQSALVSIWAAFEGYIEHVLLDFYEQRLERLTKEVLWDDLTKEESKIVEDWLSHQSQTEDNKAGKGKQLHAENLKAFYNNLLKDLKQEEKGLEKVKDVLRKKFLHFVQHMTYLFTDCGAKEKSIVSMMNFCQITAPVNCTVTVLFPSSVKLNLNEETGYELTWEQATVMVQYYLGFRNVIGHGSGSRTLDIGVLKPQFTQQFDEHLIKDSGLYMPYFKSKLRSLQDHKHKLRPGYEFVLFEKRLLLSVALVFDQHIRKAIK